MWKRRQSTSPPSSAGALAAAGVGNLRELRAGELFHVHKKDMVTGELAHGCGLHLAGVGLGVFDQFPETLKRALFADDQDVRVEHEATKRIQLFRLVARLPSGEAWAGARYGARSTPPMVPVRLCADEPRPADFPARARLVGHDDGLGDDPLGEFLDEPLAQVAAAARIECGHEHDLLAGYSRQRRKRGHKQIPRRATKHRIFHSRLKGGW